ncbi:hypothetical protein DL96DRAFT_1710361 [Flagelloscypha sp. PMI_526]|nr:hypothetical protein DL96DRAFT_1710361 [Flagelloscypha sp. PMI_526]
MNSLFCYVLVLGLLPFLVRAEDTTSKIFFWKFDSASSQLPTCQDIKIVVQSTGLNGTNLGTPPYYMLALAQNGAVESQNIGSDPTNLKWIPRFPAQTKLLLNVHDSNGSSGGVPTTLSTVATGQNTNCIPSTLSSPPKDFAVSANVTTKIETCKPWGLRITGGVKPYKVTLLALNSPVTTNITMGPQDDGYVYINRADPGSQLFAAVSDFTGRFAFGTPAVNTFGSSDASCPGGVSISTSIQVLDEDAAIIKKAETKRKTALIAGIVVPIVVLLIGGSARGDGSRGLPGGKSVKRLASTDEMMHQQQQFSPAAMETGQMVARQDGQVLSIASYLDGPPPARAHTVTGSMSTTNMTMSPTHSASPTFSVPASAYTTRSSSLHSGGIGARPGFSSFPSRSVRQPGRGSAKAIEAGYSLDEDDTGAGPSLPSAPLASSHGYAPSQYRGMGVSNPGSPVGSGRQLPIPGGQQQEIVYQHQDSAVTVRELPPPYMYQGDR